MKNQSKIQLSAFEMQLVSDAEWILTKNGILKKAKELLELLLEEQKKYICSSILHLPEKVMDMPPKISKGENYQGLPYLMLDYPRCFEQENIFAIRTMFWWGNFFSVTLHLSGMYKKEINEKLNASYQVLKEKGYCFCINEDPWEHHFEATNYVLIAELNKESFEKLIRKKSFVKLANKTPLHMWDDAGKILLEQFKQIINLIAD